MKMQKQDIAFGEKGLNTIEYFAAIAMQAILSDASDSAQRDPAGVAKKSIQYAEALIDELNKTNY